MEFDDPKQEFRLSISADNPIDALRCIIELMDKVTESYVSQLDPIVKVIILDLDKQLDSLEETGDIIDPNRN